MSMLERRTFLGAVAVTAGGLVWPARAGAGAGASSRGAQLTYEEFLKEIIPLAKALVGDISLLGQDRYLHTVAACAIRLADVPVPDMKQNSVGSMPSTYIGANDGGDPFTVLHWRMEPGSVIKPHPHIYGNVVTLGLEGEVRVENYEMEGERDFGRKGSFAVRKTVDQLLTPGTTNLVNLERSYMHGFRAGPRGARGLDITTRIKPKQPTPTLVLDPKAYDGGPGVYPASWAGVS